jgi:catechol 2,3-dioxygenase-like lactoylglutathione lyase family enzyme
MKRRDLIVGAAATLAGTAALAQGGPDHIMPKDPNARGLSGPLHTVTLITADLKALTRMYVDGLGMTLSGPVEINTGNRTILNAVWGIPQTMTWQMYMLRRPAVPRATQIRVLVMDRATPSIRKSWNRQEPGPYGMGFPTDDVPAWDKDIAQLGFTRATPEIERFPLKRADGSGYEVLEATFNGPEFLRAIAISRRDGMAQVGDLDPATKRGGPAYATQVVTDMDAMVKFFVEVLDYEVRTDRVWRAYAVPFRFVTMYARGATNGHVALAAYDAKDTLPGTGVPPAPPNRGMAIWSFPVSNIDAFQARAEGAGLELAGGHSAINVADLGKRMAITVRAPNGFLIEAFQTAA